MSVLLDAALQYCREGLHVIPIAPGRKKPLIPWTEYQTRAATEEEIRGWWQQWPNANVGLVTGKAAGLVVLDVDIRYGGDPVNLHNQAPTGWVTQTGGGGYHLFYRYPDGVSYIRSRQLKAIQGVDCKADGGYVVAPPSVSEESGRLYRWIQKDDLGGLPPHVVGVLTADDGGAESDPEEQERWLVDALKGVGQGERNSTCARLVGYCFAKDIPRDVALVMLLDWNHKNQPPLPEEEVRRTVESVYKTARRREQHQPERADQRAAQGFSVVRLDEYMRCYSVEQVPWIVDEWLPEATIGFVVAPPGSYKTWLAFDMVVAVASGKPFLGKYPVNRTGPVLIIQQEDYHGDIANRLGAIIAARFGLKAKADEEQFEIVVPPDLPIYIHPDRSLRFDDYGIMTMLEERIAELRPALVILDPLYSAASTDDYMAKTAEQMLLLKIMRDRYGCSFLIAHHTSKGKSQGEMGRERLWGSQFLNALLETGWQVARTDQPDTVTVRRHFKVARNPADVKVVFDIDTDVYPFRYETQVLDAGEAGGGADLSERIAAALHKHGPMTAAKLAEILGVHRSTTTRRLKAMVKDDMVRQDPQGRWFVPEDLPMF